jgi:two-component system, cell cycle response regulator DivK
MKAKILIVEDDPASLAFVKYLLGNYGHTILAAEDGEAGLKVARESLPDLILSDAEIPKLDGCELARRLKADPALRHIPLVAVTASAMQADRERIMAAGFDGYIAKPYVPETFVSQVEAYLPSQRPSQEEPPAKAKPKNDSKSKFIREMAEAFVATLPTLLASLHDVFEKGDFKSLRVMVHKMLGSCIFLDNPQLVESLRRLEKTIDANQTAGIKPMLEEVDRLARAAEIGVKPVCV